MKFILAAFAMTLSSLAFAHNCPNEMKAIDAKLSTQPQLPAAAMSQVRALRAEGEKHHREGRHDDSMKALGNARKLLGI